MELSERDHDVAEGGTQSVTVEISADPVRTVTITSTGLDGATGAAYSVAPVSVTFAGGEAGLLGCPRRYDVGLRCIKSDGPFIVDMEFNDPPGNDGSDDVDETVEMTVVWSQPVTFKTTLNGLPGPQGLPLQRAQGLRHRRRPVR